MKLINNLLIPLILSNSVLAESSVEIKGLDPIQEKLYSSHLSSDGEKWTCLNSTDVQINITQLNDGICDCPDGSDEPGTAACNVINEKSHSNELFYCKNEGFIPRYIDKSLVDDGVCDCCDCSDESNRIGENICSDLKEMYHSVIDGELTRAELGKSQLISYFKKAKIDIKEPSGENGLLNNLKGDIKSLHNEINVNNELIKTELNHYLSKLRQEDPILFQYEQIDFELLLDSLNATYDEIVLNSRMFTDIVHILETLAGSFNPSLNDRVVNNNVYQFQDEIARLRGEEKIGIDAKTDDEQREQLIEYFTHELPNVFWKGESSHPPEYVVKKAQFVQMLIQGKVEYTKTVFKYIDEFKAIMQDIVDNRNVNVQDEGVKDAIQMYTDYMQSYARALKKHKVVLSKRFISEMDKLINVVEINVSKILIEEEKEINNGERNVLMGFVSNLLNIDDNSNRKMLSQLKQQIAVRKNSIKGFTRDLNIKEKELATLEELQDVANEEEKASNKKLYLITELIETLPTELTCVKDLINGYKYSLCLDSATQAGFIYQIEDRENGNEVLIGNFDKTYLDKHLIKHNYLDKIKVDNLDEDIDILEHLTNSTTTVGETHHYLGPLENVNNGFIATFIEGDACWNGPLRSATVLVKCSNEFKINSVHEMTKCNYQFDVEGPWGCNF
ncbi:glucosidase 2 subunit beta [Monosporozyma unispora]|nr:hypothetical protein C6P44_002289 [Kazachstania unispora]